MMQALKIVVVAAAGTLAVAGVAMTFGDGAAVTAAATAADGRVAVVAELFTSEGCSSCPPADDQLTRLVATQPIPGVQVVALGEHVDYWDRLGWRDPFSSAAFTARQSDYASKVFRTGNIYTPQIVVDGAAEAVGSDVNAVRRAVLEAARRPKATVSVLVHAQDASLDVALTLRVPADVQLTEPADAMVAVIESGLATNVRRGENRGRVLKHSAVVRSLTAVANLAPGDTSLDRAFTLPLEPEWKRENLQVVAFLQARRSRRIVGAGLASAGS